MDFKTRHPDYAAIEEHVRRARVERSLHLGELIGNALVRAWNTLGRLARRDPKPWPARDALAKGWVPQD